MRRFLLGIISGFGSIALTLIAVYLSVSTFWPEHMPPPAISRLAQMDEKLRFIRERPDLNPRVLAVGSSIAFRQLDGRTMDAMLGTAGDFFNGGTVHLKVHQSRALAKFYLANLPRVDTVIFMTSLPDLEDCTDQPAALLDMEVAADYAFERSPEGFFYLRYFSPQRYLKAALKLSERRQALVGDLYIDAYGSGPIDIPEGERRGLRYGLITVDPRCLTELVDMSREMTNRGIHLAIIFTPIHPDYLKQYPAAEEVVCRIARATRAKTFVHKTTVLALHNDPRFGADDFYDAFHFDWSSVPRLTRLVGQEIVADALHQAAAFPPSPCNALPQRT